MDKETKKIVGLTVKEIIFSLLDLSLTHYQVFEHPHSRSIAIKNFQKFHGEERQKYLTTINYLLRKRIIKKFIHQKEEYIELSDKFKREIPTFTAKKLTITQPKKWDGKWRIIIFDIPVGDNKKRDILRSALKRLKFHQMQKSVFVHPWRCYPEIIYILKAYSIGAEVKYMVATIIEGERKVIDYFLKEGMIAKEDLRSIKAANKG